MYLVHFACLDFLVHQIGGILNAVNKAEFQSRGRQLFAMVHSPEAIGQVIVLHAAVLLDRSVTAVVVGQDQSFGRDNFAGTAAAEDTYGIFQRYTVRVVQVIGFELQPLLFHHIDGVLLLHQLQQPHTFVCMCRTDCQCSNGCNQTFLYCQIHVVSLYLFNCCFII